MTTTVQLLGTTGEHAADTQIVAYGTIQCYQGDHIVAICCCDNAGASGTTAISSISSSKTLGWGLRQRMNKTGGTVADGADIGIWEAEIGPAGFAVNDWVAINFSAATTCKSLILYRLAAATNKFHYWPTLGNYDTMNSVGYGGSSQWQMGTVQAGDCYIFAMSSEGNYVPSGYAAAGYNENSGNPATNCQGIWTGPVQVRCDTTTGTTHLSGVTQCVPVTVVGALGWQMTFNESSDRVAAYIVIREANAGPTTAPGTPSVYVNGVGSYAVSWAAPSNDGHRAVQYYHLYYEYGSGWLYHSQVAGTSTSAGGIGSGANCNFKVYAWNGVAWSLESGYSGYVQMWNTPGAPGTPSVTPNAIGGFALSWGVPGNGGTQITQYGVQYSYNNVDWTDPGWYPTTNSFQAGTFANNQLVYFRIYAANAVGWSNPSASGSGTTWRVPDPPLTTVVAPQGGGVYSLTWSTPANGGTAITDYIIEDRQNGGSWVVYPDSVGVSIGLVMSGLNNVDLWEFRVKAVNAVGQGGYGPIALSDNTLMTPSVLARTGATFAPTRTAASTADPALHGPRIGTIWAISGSITVTVVPAAEPQTGVTFAPAGIYRSATVTLPTEAQTGTTYVPLIYRSATTLPAVEVQTSATYLPNPDPASVVRPAVELQTGVTIAPTRTPASTSDPVTLAATSARFVPSSFSASGSITTTTVAKTGTTFAATVKITAATTPVTLLAKAGATFDPIEAAASTADPVTKAQTGATFAPTRSAASFVQVALQARTSTSYAAVISATGLVSVPDEATGTSTRFAVTLKINSTAILSSWVAATGVAVAPTFGAGASVSTTTASRTSAVFSPSLSVSASRVPTPVAGTSSTYAPTIKVNASVIAGGLARLSVISLPSFGIGITLTPATVAGTSVRLATTYATTGTALPSALAGVATVLAPFARAGMSLTAPVIVKSGTPLVPFFGVGTGLTPGVAVGLGTDFMPTFSITGTAVTSVMARTSSTYSVAFSTGPKAVTTTVAATSLTYVPLRTAASFVTAPVSARTGTIYASTVVVFSGTFVFPALLVTTSATYVAGSSTDRVAYPEPAAASSLLYSVTFQGSSVALASPVPRTGNTYPVSYTKTGTATPATLVRTSLTYATAGEGGATFIANFTTGSSTIYLPSGSIGRIAFPNRKAASSTLYDPTQLIALVIAFALALEKSSALYVPTSFDTTALVEVDSFIEGTSLVYDPTFATLVGVTAGRIAALGDTNWDAYDFDFAWA